MARSWIEDPENVLFDFVASELGYSPEAFRQRIREALKKQEMRPCKWRDRVRERIQEALARSQKE